TTWSQRGERSTTCPRYAPPGLLDERRQSLAYAQHGGIHRFGIVVAGTIGDALVIQPQGELAAFVFTQFKCIRPAGDQSLGQAADCLGIAQRPRQQQFLAIGGEETEPKCAVSLTEAGKSRDLAGFLLARCAALHAATEVTQPNCLTQFAKERRGDPAGLGRTGLED